ncbi:DUF2147 domain-containing protein [Planktotalea arctica]|uniref:DUF2147 domain-containing protein n=1 Tax=Planktotalea arctica TaxID=1481893 RepID=UPI00111C1760|nr:DUF2147 domain-containing protein [Planktotalea arctica]
MDFFEMQWSGFITALFLSLAPLVAQAENPIGTWHTEPDAKKQTAHVLVTKCGTGFCGKMVRAFDQSGKQIAHKNVGKRLFWDAKPIGKGDFAGRAYVPLLGKDFPATMTVTNSRMIVKGCGGPVCKSQRWTRVN